MLYHNKVYFKPNFETICDMLLNNRLIKHTRHSKLKLLKENISLEGFKQSFNKLQDYELIEVEEDKFINKFLIRFKHNDDKDLCVVLASDYDEENREPYLAIKTIWCNSSSDFHTTLDENKYCKGE